jgi:glycosyltransferase involved in cell wall biosynthesis
MAEGVWITWEKQKRNETLSAKLGIPLYVFEFDHSRINRYLRSCIHSLKPIIQEKPSFVIAQNPSLVLIIYLFFLKKIKHFNLIIDAHSGGVINSRGKRLIQFLLNMCNRHADLVIVTNTAHKEFVNTLGGHAIICEDPLPKIDLTALKNVRLGTKAVFYICSFSNDEPYLEVLEAAEILGISGFTTYISGNYAKAGIIHPKEYPTIKFTGYADDNIYYSYLYHCNVALCLTKNENCLLCGNYESLALNKPLVTSNKTALKNYFKKAALYTSHNPRDIASSVIYAYDNSEKLKRQAVEWKAEAEVLNRGRILDLRNTISNLRRAYE